MILELVDACEKLLGHGKLLFDFFKDKSIRLRSWWLKVKFFWDSLDFYLIF